MKKHSIFGIVVLSAILLSSCGSAKTAAQNKIYYQYVVGEKVKIFDIHQEKFQTTGIVNYGCAVEYKNNTLYIYGLSSDGYNSSTPTKIYKSEVKVVEDYGNMVFTESNEFVAINDNEIIGMNNPKYSRFCTKAYLGKNNIETEIIK